GGRFAGAQLVGGRSLRRNAGAKKRRQRKSRHTRATRKKQMPFPAALRTPFMFSQPIARSFDFRDGGVSIFARAAADRGRKMPGQSAGKNRGGEPGEACCSRRLL